MAATGIVGQSVVYRAAPGVAPASAVIVALAFHERDGAFKALIRTKDGSLRTVACETLTVLHAREANLGVFG